MFEPQYADFVESIRGYEYFLSAAIFFSLGIAYIFLRILRKGKRIPMRFNLWTILLIGLIVRIPLMNQNYWYDETFSSAIAQVGMGDFFTTIRGDVHPPGYYLIIRAFVAVFGHNDFTMRLPALLSSLGLIVTMYHIGTTYGGKRVGKWAAMLTALMPVAIYYATEARYPMFLALMLSIAYMGIQRKKNLLFGASLAIVGVTHVNGWIYIVIMGGVWVLSQRKFLALLAPFSTIALWLPIGLSQAKDVADGFWLIQYPPYRHIIEMTIGSRFKSAETAILPMAIVMAIIFVAIIKWRKKADLLWFAVVVIVPLAQWTVGVVWHPIYLPRTLLFSALLLIIPIASWLDTDANLLLAFGGIISLMVAIGSLYLLDRSSPGDDAIRACDGYPTIYTTNNHTGIWALHYSDASVMVYENGNSSAQQLTHEAQAALFDDVGNILERDNPSNICVVSQVSVFNSRDELAHLVAIERQFNPQTKIVKSDGNSRLGYYLVMYIN